MGEGEQVNIFVGWRDRGVTYVVTFQYSDRNTIRLEMYRNNQAIINQLLARESDKLIGGS
jgi:hypothetical protein